MARLLVEDTDHEYDISQEDLLIYAERIGINVETEKHLMWIAEKGLTSRVPKPWVIYCDEKDRVYYYNTQTKVISWHHPLDKEYAAFISEERSKSKSLNSASSDYGFESKPLDSINDPTLSSGRFPKAPLQLSSLADAPPLLSSGKNSPLSLSREKNDGGLSSRKLDFGRIENRRGAQLAPVRLNALKMPTASIPKASSGMSFMPKGATLSKNIRRVKADESFGNQIDQIEDELDYGQPTAEDSNESINSDEGSKYSYEETEDEEKNNQGSFGLLDASQLSPMHSADESPDALDINSLVQLGTKSPQRLGSSLKREQLENVLNKENSPSLSLRKVGQPSFLKPLSQVTMKKNSNKSSKAKKKAPKIKYYDEIEEHEDKISARNDEQQVMLDEIQKEWLAMQDKVEKEEKERYEEMVKDSSKKLEEEEMKLRNENLEKISKIKMELKKKIEEEESAAEKSLQALKELNKNKIVEEEDNLKKQLQMTSESLREEIIKLEEKNAAELAGRKKELEEAFKKEIENVQIIHDSNKKSIEEAHTVEISNIQKLHENEIKEMQSSHQEEVDGLKTKVSGSESKQLEKNKELESLEALIKEEAEKYKQLLKDKEDILTEIISKKEHLEKLKNEAEEMQTGIAELQDETEKNENDLDLLRTEKSGLISELSILKENINNEKSNLSNLEKKVKSTFKEAGCSNQLSEMGINTVTFDTASEAIQVSVVSIDVSCQVQNISVPTSDAICQTAVVKNFSTISCQTDPVPLLNGTNVVPSSHDKSVSSSNPVDKNLENALSGLGLKIDSRISGIENQLRLLQENLSKTSTNELSNSNQAFVQNRIPEVKSVPNAENKNLSPVYSTDSSVPIGLFSSNVPISSQNKCQCEFGDPASCRVLQDVKNSVYQLNSILCATFSPPLGGSNLYQAVPSLNSYSSPFNSIYSQLRDMQDKHRLTELKHKCENEAIKQFKGASSKKTDINTSEGFSHHEHLKPSYHWMHSNLYSYNVPDDPLIRARNVVLREQARNWKEQQQLNSSAPYILSLNSASERSQSSGTAFASTQNVPLSQESFLNFDVDPETDYNMWMTRLNALQLRIRSHRMM